ncbi:hypothetical protein OJAV_G00017800 [Oryzias javanicus]|uniref:Uncharacterized protein n=1 Tax=Oryzias javanicus TaxID=123683 RepID=A0A437DL32_ORYJA|nr:hypothetical protein OJAV_G00017800 [Oryzias javanicus]
MMIELPSAPQLEGAGLDGEVELLHNNFSRVASERKSAEFLTVTAYDGPEGRACVGGVRAEAAVCRHRGTEDPPLDFSYQPDPVGPDR